MGVCERLNAAAPHAMMRSKSRSRPVLARLALTTCVCVGLCTSHPGAAWYLKADVRVISAAYRDLDGDHDAFPDTGESGRLVLTIKNFGPTLTGVNLYLTTDDPNVACISTPAYVLGNLAAKAVRTIGSFDPTVPGFTFRASDTLHTISTATPANVTLYLTATASGYGTSDPYPIRLAADIDAAPGLPSAYVLGPDGVAGTGDDGTVLESFDRDRDGDGTFSTADTFGLLDAGTGEMSHGSFAHGGAASGTDALAAIACGGFNTPAEGNLECRLDTDYPMDWHFHCPAGATGCPNTESGGFGALRQGCVGGCSYNTPADGQKALSLPNSLHMGAHFDPNVSSNGDTTHLRTLQAFVSAPINLAIPPRDLDDLTLSFWQIVDLFGPINSEGNMCLDCAQVHIQSDRDPDPAVDDWGPWDTLTPFQSSYDMKFRAWSAFGAAYCDFTPVDTGSNPPAPRGVHETMCAGEHAWSKCGSLQAVTTGPSDNCYGGVLDPSGRGTWVQTKFNLAPFLGRRIRIRWMASTWQMDGVTSSYSESLGYRDLPDDNGWWLDDIRIAGAVQGQSPPALDVRPSPGSVCPVACDPQTGDRGTHIVLRATDSLLGPVFDGFDSVPVTGTTVVIDASASTLPGGCLGGLPQFQYLVDGGLVQDWTAQPFLSHQTTYSSTFVVTVRMRCSSDPDCTSLSGATLAVPVDTLDGDDTVFGESINPLNLAHGVDYDGGARATTLRFWTSRNGSVDVYRGLIGPGISKGTLLGPPSDPNYRWLVDTSGAAGSSATCLFSNLPVGPAAGGGGAGATGSMDQASDPDPAVGFAVYYLASRNTAAGSSLNQLGCANPGVCGSTTTRTGAACHTSADCPPSGYCFLTVPANPPPVPLPFACPLGYPLVREVPPAAVC